MTRRLSLLITVIISAIIVSQPSFAADPVAISDFAGRWQGVEVATPIDAITPDDLSVEIAADDGGFQLSWMDLGQLGPDRSDAKTTEARFSRTDRAGVFEYKPESGSFLDRMFASPAAGNPLEGETLLWARIDTDALVVYSLTIDENGGFGLDHYSWTRTEDGLMLHYRQRTHDSGEQLAVEGQLQQADN